MRKTKNTASVDTFDLFGNKTRTEFPVYVDANDRLFIKAMGDYISIFDPCLTRNNIRILQNIGGAK